MVSPHRWAPSDTISYETRYHLIIAFLSKGDGKRRHHHPVVIASVQLLSKKGIS